MKQSFLVGQTGNDLSDYKVNYLPAVVVLVFILESAVGWQCREPSEKVCGSSCVCV